MLEDQNNKGSCRRRASAVVPRAEKIGDSFAADHNVPSEESESSPICRGGTRLGNPVVTVLPVQNKNLPEDPEEPDEVPGADEETESHLHWQFLGIWQVLRELSWNHCTSTPHRSETNGIAERAVRRVKEGTSAVLLQSVNRTPSHVTFSRVSQHSFQCRTWHWLMVSCAQVIHVSSTWCCCLAILHSSPSLSSSFSFSWSSSSMCVGSMRSSLCASANEELGTLADNNPLTQSGLDNEWWADCLQNIQDKLSDWNSSRKAIRNALWRTSNTVWSKGRISPYFCERFVATASVRLKSLARCISRLCIIRGGDLERRHYGRRHWRIGGDGRIWTPRPKAQCKGSVNAAKKWKIRIPSRRWNSQNLWERTASENIHLYPGTSGTRRWTRNSQGESGGLSSPIHLQIVMTEHWMMRKLKMISDLLLWNSFIVITLYQESNCICHKKKHFLFHWSTSTLPEPLTRHWMFCWKNTLVITGTWMEKENYQMHGQASQDLPHRTKGHLMGTHGPGGDLQVNKQPLVQTMYGQICVRICLMQQGRKQNKNGLSRNPNSTMPDNWEECSLLNQTMKNSSSQSKPARRKFEVPMPAAMPCKIPTKSSGEARRNIGKRKTKYACVVDADESTRPKARRSSTQTSPRSCRWKRDEFSESLQSCSQIHSDASSNEHSGCKGSSGKIMGKTGENSGMAADESQK